MLLDGGFVKKKLEQANHHFPTVPEIMALCATILAKPALAGAELFRIYYYDAPPFEGSVRNPLSRVNVNYSNTPIANQNKSLIDTLELQPDVAVRRGIVKCSGWKLGLAAYRRLIRAAAPYTVTAGDFVPDMQQKGVDMRIGLDIAWIALKRMAEVLVIVTGDSDLVPVMKFARKEGMKVYVEIMGHPVARELKAHADRVL